MHLGEELLPSHCCCICQEVRHRQLPQAYLERYLIGDRTCMETEDFIVYPSISPLVAGHVLIFPKRHVTSLSSLSYIAGEGLIRLVDWVLGHISNRFGAPYLFEHGVPGDTCGGCGVTHAHLHILPLVRDLADRVDSRVLEKYPATYSGHLRDVLMSVGGVSSYLVFGRDPDLIYLSLASQIASQYMRQVIAKEQRCPSWDWRKLSGYDLFHCTFESFHEADLDVS